MLAFCHSDIQWVYFTLMFLTALFIHLREQREIGRENSGELSVMTKRKKPIFVLLQDASGMFFKTYFAVEEVKLGILFESY